MIDIKTVKVYRDKEPNGVLYLNPGGAGHRRFGDPITVAKLLVCGRSLKPGSLN